MANITITDTMNYIKNNYWDELLFITEKTKYSEWTGEQLIK